MRHYMKTVAPSPNLADNGTLWSNEGRRTSACGFIIFDSRTRFECILCQAAEKSANLRRRGFPRNMTPGGQLKGLKSQNCLLEFEFLAFFNPPFPTTPDARNNQETPIRNPVNDLYKTVYRFLRFTIIFHDSCNEKIEKKLKSPPTTSSFGESFAD